MPLYPVPPLAGDCRIFDHRADVRACPRPCPTTLPIHTAHFTDMQGEDSTDTRWACAQVAAAYPLRVRESAAEVRAAKRYLRPCCGSSVKRSLALRSPRGAALKPNRARSLQPSPSRRFSLPARASRVRRCAIRDSNRHRDSDAPGCCGPQPPAAHGTPGWLFVSSSTPMSFTD